MEEAKRNEEAIWQRVAQRPEVPQGESLRSLLLASLELAGIYRYLTQTLTGKSRERARQLLDGELRNISCLKGIAILSGRREEVLKIWNPGRESAFKLLEKCYHRTRRCLVEYMSRTAEGEFGTVFQKMADREAHHCGWIAELLGSLK